MSKNQPVTDELLARVEKLAEVEARIRVGRHNCTRQAARSEPEDWQERHSPTELHELRMGVFGEGRVAGAIRQRLFDGRLLRAVPAILHPNMHDLLECWSAFVGPLALKAVDWERESMRGPSGRASQSVEDAINATRDRATQFRDWVHGAENCDTNAVVQIVCLGEGAREQEARLGQRNGDAVKNLRRGLEEWGRITWHD